MFQHRISKLEVHSAGISSCRSFVEVAKSRKRSPRWQQSSWTAWGYKRITGERCFLLLLLPLLLLLMSLFFLIFLPLHLRKTPNMPNGCSRASHTPLFPISSLTPTKPRVTVHRSTWTIPSGQSGKWILGSWMSNLSRKMFLIHSFPMSCSPSFKRIELWTIPVFSAYNNKHPWGCWDFFRPQRCSIVPSGWLFASDKDLSDFSLLGNIQKEPGSVAKQQNNMFVEWDVGPMTMLGV